MHLVTGAPGSGKTSFCLDRVRECLRAGDSDWKLLVPTATLAEHLRNQLAREGFLFPPRNVETLAHFVRSLTVEAPTITEGTLVLLVAEALKRRCPNEYLRVSEFPGFHRAVASAISEFLAAGGSVTSRLPAAMSPFASVLREVVDLASQRGLQFPAHQIRYATEQVRASGVAARRVWLAGFYSVSVLELKLIKALDQVSQLTVAVGCARPEVQSLAATETDLPRRPTSLQPQVFAARTLDGEVTEIARRILHEQRTSRNWRDIAVVVRSEDPYVPALRDAFDRFGIPARFYFGTPSGSAAPIQYFTLLVDALLSGWEFERALAAFRSAGSPLEHDDRFEFDLRRALPGAGLQALADIAGPGRSLYFKRLAQVSAWVDTKAAPDIWAQRFESLASLVSQEPLPDKVSSEQVVLYRSQAAALTAWPELLRSTALALAPQPLDCEAFRDALRTMTASTTLRYPDRRRNVVAVIDVYEARQWRVPKVFLCGLSEKSFPKHHAESAVLPDTLKKQISAQGISLRTAADYQSEERALFETVLARATESVTLSYPMLDSKAETVLPSLFLDHFLPGATLEAPEVRPVPQRVRAPEPRPLLADHSLLTQVAARHSSVRATAIESFLQCPFQFFADQTLGLERSPCDPFDRLNLPAQGVLVHRALERSAKENQPLGQAFEAAFTEYCERERVPRSYRTEAIRLELLRNLEMFAADTRLPAGAFDRYEVDFALTLEGAARVTGRIDRLQIGAGGEAVVVDYKYQSPASLKRTCSGHEDRTRVQGGLYLLAVSQLGSYTPVGMVYCGVKREVSFGGWVLQPHCSSLDQGCSSEGLREVMQVARETTLRAVSEIREGRILPQPADEKRCDFCSYSAICRVDKKAAEEFVLVHGAPGP